MTEDRELQYMFCSGSKVNKNYVLIFASLNIYNSHNSGITDKTLATNMDWIKFAVSVYVFINMNISMIISVIVSLIISVSIIGNQFSFSNFAY